MIAHVGGILTDQTRPADIVSRFGGEEFVVFLKKADREDAGIVAERIRQSVDKTPLLEAGERVAVTVSIGVSSITMACEIEDAIKSADSALYQAKTAGRNRVVFAEQASTCKSLD